MKATIQFINNYGKHVVIDCKFNDKRHLDNFINYIQKRYNYVLDEVWY